MGLGLVASALIFLISRTHEWMTEFADRLFDWNFRRAEEHLAKVGRTIERAQSLGEIERLLVEEPLHALKLASAAVFREEDGVFRRRASAGWGAGDADMLRPGEPPLAGRLDGGPFRIDTAAAVDSRSGGLPGDLALPGSRPAGRRSPALVRGRPLRRPRGRNRPGRQRAQAVRRASFARRR